MSKCTCAFPCGGTTSSCPTAPINRNKSMETKGTLHKRFMDAVLAKKINLTAAQNSAVTMFFGVEKSKDLISNRSLSLYEEGRQIVNEIIGINHVN